MTRRTSELSGYGQALATWQGAEFHEPGQRICSLVMRFHKFNKLMQ